jgi:hypothetical protein
VAEQFAEGTKDSIARSDEWLFFGKYRVFQKRALQL